MSNASNALFVGREVGSAAGGLGRAMFRWPAAFAVACWLLYGVAAGLNQAALANLHPVREVRAQCTMGPSNEITEGRNWATCQPGTGEAIYSVTYDLSRPAAAAANAAGIFRLAASVFTVGALALVALSVLGSASRTPGQPRRYVGRAAAHVRREHSRAKRDVREAKARLGKVGDKRARKWGKRWSAEAAAGETYTRPGRVDRWILRQAKPPKTRAAKKGERAAKKVGKAVKRAEQTSLDAEWAGELSAIEARMDGAGVRTSTKKIVRDGKKVGDAMRVDAGGPASQLEAWRQVIEDPTEGELPPPPPFVAGPSSNTPTAAADRLANVAGAGEWP